MNQQTELIMGFIECYRAAGGRAEHFALKEALEAHLDSVFGAQDDYVIALKNGLATQGLELYASVDMLCIQADTDTAETIDWLCGEHSGMSKLFTSYFGRDILENSVMDLADIYAETARLSSETNAVTKRDALEIELKAILRDAERYRLLRNGENWPAVFPDSDEWEPLRGEELDKAVDKEIVK